ncbi:putative gustatory receptor 2a [Episyrphus balteatus]|uniref:putative gustatory receptor 2a n=1 Tax=Episyrphus balteatus TaxID=286459 RepID=UPI0024859D14|nr:putative gustatory receptor 2a [Episyrphus balteatus]
MNILESISIPHRLFQLCNLSQLKLEKKTWSTAKSRFLEIYSYIVVLCSTALLLYGIFVPTKVANKLSSDIGKTMDFIQLVSIRIAHIACVIETLCRRNEQQMLLKRIQEIDRLFEISLNIDVDNRKFRSKNLKSGLAMITLYLSCEICIILVTVYGPSPDLVSFWILYFVPFIICGIRYFQYFIFIAIIKQRFRKLIDVLANVSLLNANKLSEKEKLYNGKVPATVKLVKNLNKFNKNLYRNGFDLTNLLVIRDIYNRLWELSILVNKCFGLSILVIVGMDFLAITSNLYWIFLNLNKYSTVYEGFVRVIASAIWSLSHVFNILTIALMCHKTVESTSEIALGVHRIQIDLYNDNHNSLIEQFSLQLIHQKLHFTAFGFFTIDCSLLYTIVGATTTYLIILIQFHMSEQKEITAKTSPPATDH